MASDTSSALKQHSTIGQMGYDMLPIRRITQALEQRGQKLHRASTNPIKSEKALCFILLI